MKISKIVKRVVAEAFSTPDTIFKGNNDDYESWATNDAIPFFVLYNGKVIYGDNSKRHADYLNKMSYSQLTKFSNKIILQGRYWIPSNSFSFWSIGEDHHSNVLLSVLNICNEYGSDPTTAKIYYYNKMYSVVMDDRYGNYYLQEEDNSTTQSDANKVDSNKDEYIEYWIQSDGNFIDNTYGIIARGKDGRTTIKDLNAKEKLCTTIYQIYCDFLKNDSYSKFTIRDLDKYLFSHYNCRYKTMMDFFHNNVRRLLVLKKNVQADREDEYISEGNLEDVALDADLDFSEYKLVYYSHSDEVYSLNVQTTDIEKFNKCLESARKADLVVDRRSRLPFGEETIYTARFRNK